MSLLDNRAKIEKDICYLFYVQNEYGAFMPDLDFTNEFALPYWSILRELSDSDEEFIKVGCMIIILLMALDYIDGSGDVISSKYDSCIIALEDLIPYSSDENSLKELTLHTLNKSMKGDKLTPSDQEKLSWAYSQYVKGYFCNRCT